MIKSHHRLIPTLMQMTPVERDTDTVKGRRVGGSEGQRTKTDTARKKGERELRVLKQNKRIKRDKIRERYISQKKKRKRSERKSKT